MSESERPISPKGKLHAEALSETLNADHLFASPYSRAIATFSLMADRFGLVIEIVPDLRERKIGRRPADGLA